MNFYGGFYANFYGGFWGSLGREAVFRLGALGQLIQARLRPLSAATRPLAPAFDSQASMNRTAAHSGRISVMAAKRNPDVLN